MRGTVAPAIAALALATLVLSALTLAALTLAPLARGPAHAGAAAGTTEVSATLDRWAEALGGRDRLAAVEIVYVRRDVSMMGLSGVVEEWAARDGRYRVELALGDGLFTQTTVLDGVTGWRRDQNGKVSELSGHELAREKSSAHLAIWAHLRPDRRPDETTLAGVEDSTGSVIVRVTPEGGAPVTVYLDPASHLPARSEVTEADHTVTTRHLDWKPIDGILFPARETQSSGDPQYDSAFSIAEVRFDVAPDPDRFARPADTARDYRFAAGSSARDIPIEVYGVHIYIQPRVGASDPLGFLLDTGAGVSVLDAIRARELGLTLEGKIEGRGAGEGTVEVNLIPGVSFALPGVEVTGQTVAAIALDAIAPRLGRPLDGILGYDFLSRFVTEIDYAGNRIHLHDPATFEYRGKGAVVPIRIENNHPRVTLTITPPGRDPIECDVLVDTGASDAIELTKPFTEKHDLLRTMEQKRFVRGAGAGVGGETSTWFARLSRVEIGGIGFENVLAGFSDDEAGAGADPTVAGLIGGELLRRFTVIFDYEHLQMILEPNPHASEPFENEMCGLVLTTGGPGAWRTYIVHRVHENSPAAKAGLQEGDVIEAFDGRSHDEVTMPELREYFRQHGETIRLTVRRGEERFERTIRLERMI